VYKHEIPGGQYSNLRPQVAALGLEDKFEEVKQNYDLVNEMFGDIVKVTPSSKVVGDMAIFMTSNGLTKEDVLAKGKELSFPESVVGMFKGDLGQPEGGFPEELQKVILKGATPFTDRPNAHLTPIDFDQELEIFKKEYGEEYNELDFISYKLYPKVFNDYCHFRKDFGDPTRIPTTAFFYGLKPNEEILVEISAGKVIIIKLLFVSEPDELGKRLVSFELNGQARRIQVKDKEVKSVKISNKKIETEGDVGSPLQGRISSILVKEGDQVEENTPLFVIEAMKMESTISASAAGTVQKVVLAEGDMVEQNDLVVQLKKMRGNGLPAGTEDGTHKEMKLAGS
jgi:pyruvate carboxylase